MLDIRKRLTEYGAGSYLYELEYDPLGGLVKLANAMLAGQIHLIEGARIICHLRFAIGDPDNDAFFPIRAIESETDHYPLGKVRARCDEDYLREVDT